MPKGRGRSGGRSRPSSAVDGPAVHISSEAPAQCDDSDCGRFSRFMHAQDLKDAEWAASMYNGLLFRRNRWILPYTPAQANAVKVRSSAFQRFPITFVRAGLQNDTDGERVSGVSYMADLRHAGTGPWHWWEWRGDHTAGADPVSVSRCACRLPASRCRFPVGGRRRGAHTRLSEATRPERPRPARVRASSETPGETAACRHGARGKAGHTRRPHTACADGHMREWPSPASLSEEWDWLRDEPSMA